MTVRIGTITFDCHDPWLLVQFWSRLTGYGDDPENPNSPGDPMMFLRGPDGGPGLLFIPVPEGKVVKNRVHLDVVPIDGTRDEQVAALLAEGATLIDDQRTEDGAGWVVLGDPEGNEFCVERSDAERAGPR
jgi:hypothetical protein